MVTDYKTLLINLGTFIFSMANVDVFLKITLLLLTIGYTAHKWYLMNKTMEKSKKKFKDTRVGKFLTKAAPNILKGVSDVVPDAGILKLIGGLISKDEVLTPKDKEEALKLLEIDIIEMQEISKRWSADMSSDSWLSKNVRPMMLIFLTISTWCLILMDSLAIDFGVGVEWIDLLKSLLITTYVAYFGSRGIEKYKYISQK